MTYTQFKHQITTNKYIPNYYQLLVFFKNEILEDIHQLGQNNTAQLLNITPAKFSGIVNILKVL